MDARRSDKPGIYKSSVLVGPDGPTGERYDKMRLVPFGEYVPARSLLGWATSVGEAAGEDRRRGSEQVVMDAGDGLRIGPMVCFESAFPDMEPPARRRRRRGAARPVVDIDLPAHLGARAARLARRTARRRDRPPRWCTRPDRRLRRLRRERRPDRVVARHRRERVAGVPRCRSRTAARRTSATATGHRARRC
ncbi:hypothetical protein LV779_35635 [Streptomyces thinghirensis]|nr:hypothetical protein [Streptomyces thinghirensis]